MNKTDLIDALAPRLGGSRATAATAVESLVDIVLREVAGGGSVGITGFGTFERVERAPRTGRNPRTGDAVPIAGTATPRFRPGTYFKDAVADPDVLPEDGPAGLRAPAGGEAGLSNATSRAASRPSTGAPATVRRTGPPVPDRSSSRRPRSGTEAGPSRGRTSTAPSGTPATVRKDSGGPAEVESDAPAQTTPAKATPAKATKKAPEGAKEAANGASSGEEITSTMISVKKARLAQVKVDELAAREKQKNKGAKKSKKKSKKKKKKDKGEG